MFAAFRPALCWFIEFILPSLSGESSSVFRIQMLFPIVSHTIPHHPPSRRFNTLYTIICPYSFPSFSHHVPNIFSHHPSFSSCPKNPTCAASSAASSASSTTSCPGLQPCPAAVASASKASKRPRPAAKKSTVSRGRFWCLHQRVITWPQDMAIHVVKCHVYHPMSDVS